MISLIKIQNDTLAIGCAFVCLNCILNAEGQNLIVNGDFSNGTLSGWTTTPVAPTTITYAPVIGNPPGSAFLARNTSESIANANYLYQIFPVIKGAQYKLKAQWKGDLLNGGTGRNWAEVYINFTESNAGFVPGTIRYKKATDGGANSVPMPWDWESITASPDSSNPGPADGVFTASGNFMTVAFNLGGRAQISNNTEPGFFWVDNVSVSPYPAPSAPAFTNVSKSSGDIILEGINGPANGAYWMLLSTSLSMPVASWPTVGTGSFDLNGSFAFTNTSTIDPVGFFGLRVLSDEPIAGPAITVQPQNNVMALGQNALFNVVARGTEPLTYSWYFNTNVLITTGPNPSITVSNVQLYDVGWYSVVVTNLFGSTQSAYAQLTIATNFHVPVPDGYATQNGGTSGGGDAAPIIVTDAADFRAAVSSSMPGVVVVQGRIDLDGNVSIGSNKTVMGLDSNSGLYNGTVFVWGTNYIFRNLMLGPTTNDVMEISGARNVYITQCEFYGSTDELCSIVRQADYVTISWSKFHFPAAEPHSFAHLIGNGDDVIADRGKLHVTLHHNWYAAGLRGRLPRVRFGHVHIYNNFYNSVGTSYCIGIGVECKIRVENTHFESVNNPWADYGGALNGEIGWANLKFVNCSQPTFMPNALPVFEVPYTYPMDPKDNVKAIVTSGAGNVFSP